MDWVMFFVSGHLQDMLIIILSYVVLLTFKKNMSMKKLIEVLLDRAVVTSLITLVGHLWSLVGIQVALHGRFAILQYPRK